jgi:uncharacterized alpha-E superfamily protein
VDGRRRADLGAFLSDVEAQLRRLGRALERTYFEDVLAPLSLVEVIA